VELTRERGDATIQTMLAMPVLVLMLCIGVQAAALIHASSVASLAADRGAVSGAAAVTRGGSSEAAIAESIRVVDDVGSHLLSTPGAWHDGTSMFVTVQVKVPQVVPFMPNSVTRSAIAPIESFIPEDVR